MTLTYNITYHITYHITYYHNTGQHRSSSIQSRWRYIVTSLPPRWSGPAHCVQCPSETGIRFARLLSRNDDPLSHAFRCAEVDQLTVLSVRQAGTQRPRLCEMCRSCPPTGTIHQPFVDLPSLAPRWSVCRLCTSPVTSAHRRHQWSMHTEVTAAMLICLLCTQFTSACRRQSTLVYLVYQYCTNEPVYTDDSNQIHDASPPAGANNTGNFLLSSRFFFSSCLDLFDYLCMWRQPFTKFTAFTRVLSIITSSITDSNGRGYNGCHIACSSIGLFYLIGLFGSFILLRTTRPWLQLWLSPFIKIRNCIPYIFPIFKVINVNICQFYYLIQQITFIALTWQHIR